MDHVSSDVATVKNTEVCIVKEFKKHCRVMIAHLIAIPELNFKIFKKIWNKMNFQRVFEGAKLKEAASVSQADELVGIVRSYLVRPNADYQERVAALFMLYALVQLPPVLGRAEILLTPDDQQYCILVDQEARRRKQKDVLYCLGALAVHGHIRLAFAHDQYGLERETHQHFRVAGRPQDLSSSVIPGLEGSHGEIPALNSLRKLLKVYSQTKESIIKGTRKDKRMTMRRNLSLVNDNFAEELCDSLHQRQL